MSTRGPEKTRHDRRREATRSRIVSAAAELFGEQGVQGTKVSEVCERADVAQQTFFNHFPSKADLARELTRRGHDFVLAAIESANREGSDTADRIGGIFRRIYEATAETGPMHQEMLSELILVAEEDPAYRSRQIRLALGELVRTGIESGEVTRDHDLDDLVDLIVGSLHTLMSEWANRPDFPIVERSARKARLLGDALAPRGATRGGQSSRRRPV